MPSPQLVYISTLVPATALPQSATLTVGFSHAGFEAVVEFQGGQPNTTNISAGWEAYAYASTDGGATYETVATTSFAIVRSPNTVDRKTMRLPPGQWLLRIISGGNVAMTYSFIIGTQLIVTAVA